MTVEAGHVQEVPVALAPTAPPRVEPAPVPVPASAPVSLARPWAQEPVARRSPPPSRAPWILVGVGLSALAAGGFVAAGVYYGLANEAQTARNNTCPSPCDPAMPSYAAAAGQDRRYRDHLQVTTWSLVAGASLAAAATLWWVLARPTTQPVAPTVAALPGGGAVAGVASAW